MLSYLLRHDGTISTTGYFACVPEGFDVKNPSSLTSLVDLLAEIPTDTFLHDLLLREMTSLPAARRRGILSSAAGHDVALALEAEARLVRDEPDSPPSDDLERLWEATGFGLLLWGRNPDRRRIRSSVRRLRESISGHAESSFVDRTVPVDLTGMSDARPPDGPDAVPSAADTSRDALDRLIDAGLVDGPEYRHVSSLAPVGLMRRWPLSVRVRDGRLSYTLRGSISSWGRGVSIAAARVSCVMEIVERTSAYLSVEGGHVTRRLYGLPVRKAGLSTLRAEGIPAVDPDCLAGGMPHRDKPISWVPSTAPDGSSVMVPLQAVGLFCNLDEPSLHLPQISTGLASGTSGYGARLSGVLEVIERDADARTPFAWDDCFLLTTDSSDLGHLLHAYGQYGIHPVFRSLRSPCGVPCFEAFVTMEDGTCLRATAARLSGPQAILSALTEVPCPFPCRQRTRTPPGRLRTIRWEDLPDYDLRSAPANLALVEKALLACGRRPLYVDLTRDDLRLPVVRALIPGMIPTSDFDIWSSLPDNLQETDR